jgi:hypothetical protein
MLKQPTTITATIRNSQMGCREGESVVMEILLLVNEVARKQILEATKVARKPEFYMKDLEPWLNLWPLGR